MQPSTDRPSGSGSGDRGRQLRRYGPLVAILAVLAIVAGVLVFAGGDDGDDETATDPGEETGGEVEGVLSYEEAEEQGRLDEVTFPEGCDEERGRVAIPSFFAPPCYADVEGDNGGATATGVTGDTIKVVAYIPIDDDPILGLITGSVGIEDTGDETAATYQGYRDLYQSYYQTYGREVELVEYRATGTALDEEAARADAQAIADMEPFAVWGGPVLTSAFADELAARQVICFGCLGGGLPEWYDERSPYTVNVGKMGDQTRLTFVEYITKKLAGRNAEFAGDEAMHDQERVFGSVNLEINEESATLSEDFENDLEEEGVEVTERVSYSFDPGRLQEQADQIMARMKGAGVTTILFRGDPVAPANLTQAATSQDYFPEWVVDGGNLVDSTVFARTYDQEQWAHAFGVSSLTARAEPLEQNYNYIYRWWTGEEPPARDTNPVLYPSPSLFFSALQVAGPNLTPESLQAGLFNLEPTPEAITNPSISFGDHGIWPYTDYNGIDDATEIFWDPDETGPDEINRDGTGMWRYVDGGKRYLYGEWDEEPSRAFQEEGSVAILEDPPEDERPPDYPSPAEDR
jgi:Periplasmic binding protein